jgi:hypothetical protein
MINVSIAQDGTKTAWIVIEKVVQIVSWDIIGI